MPSVLTYPGVYVEELPSGVRTITGVGTSITAFVGYTASGPSNRAVRLFSFADFERGFGGLNRGSPVSYAVQQFFANGGTDAYVVRVAAGAGPATVLLTDGGGAPATLLAAEALTPGAWGNNLRLEVDYATTNPGSTFNLTVTRVDPETQAAVETEQFRNLSMNSASPAYAVATVNAGSRLVRLTRGTLTFGNAGVSTSGALTGFAGGIPAGKNRLALAVDGAPYTLNINSPENINSLLTARNRINTAIGANPALAGKVAATVSGDTLVLTSASTGESSSVAVLPGGPNDIAPFLKLGLANGGTEVEGAAQHRPLPTGTVGGNLAAATSPVSGALSVTVVSHTAGGTDTLLPAVALNLPNTPIDANLASKLQTFLRSNIPGAVGQSLTVDVVANRLRVRVDGRYPFATVGVTGAAATALQLPADPSAGTNVQRYALGLGVNRGAQGAGATGSDGSAPLAGDIIGSPAAKTGMYALADVDLFNLLCIPETATLGDADGKAVIAAALALCVDERAFLVVDPPAGSTLNNVAAWAVAATGATGAARNAAVYWPRIMAADPLDNFRVRSMPASGAIAGVMARTDAERGVWKAPAGTDAALRATQGVSYPLTDMENGPLNKAAVNALRTFPAFGSVVWGARTRAGSDDTPDDYRYVPVRRLALFIEESLFRGTQWVVFEPNGEALWAQIRLNVGAFMNNLFRQGAFKGTTPAQAYLVRCDATTTTQNDIDLGIVRIVVGFAPLKPAEFVILQIQQLAGQVSV